ncbi:beta-1,3-glucosyltransferase [Episyrphus balteatus]|uniref:beta-1,3-glucosyltransferase n=1 Tax=Episyrphus balteatus TaxID=286459 RepID=UPI0024867C2E|nr:beta-1,3-glucosyltransferase [Episyrphus balteatus]XP_055857780.1 beta-1,3-glucosyltransferase [Episyrphus balteatus]XP_055857789.1 beta-1,3-glucosyltransferase [Episyrphus balteatus]XP_055857793.1 beta-1,3-glucosyltransferase [Episyrphus balteatus]XP_055857798.1 beta-1,3-glucosyltransferase [Episyrphus balteatus]XP_055857808.1 beta-1,3-glucosyltransferase [Episyrphus balteatus]XP_055857817.1 beta-1,3-glucosyltransferase [Episyrphus balteatus]
MEVGAVVVGIFLFIKLSYALAPSELLILIISQENSYHKQLNENLRSNIYKQSISLSTDHVIHVHVLHEIFNHPGDWTFLAVLPKLTTSNLIKSNTKWIVLCEDRSLIQLKPLIDNLSQEDYTKEQYFGYPLYDQEATIIHHFAFFENPRWFAYPMLQAGVIFTVPLVQHLAEYVSKVKRTMDFSIDASHELARFIMEYVKPKSHMHHETRTPTHDYDEDDDDDVKDVATKGFVSHVAMRNGDSIPKKKATSTSRILMQPVPYVCPSVVVKGLSTDCALCVNSSVSSSCIAASRETIYFVIKTCHKFLTDRVPVIQRTWGRYAVHKRFFSDNANKDIPTFATGVPNTETGHCLKTLSILKLALNDVERHNEISNRPILWIFLSDDDTILSVSGVCEVLGCFDPTADVYLGERYGFRLHSDDGFNYITGGGGIAFSLPTVRKIVQSCTCPTISSPDDMILGSCLHGLNVEAIHSWRFHQARPMDYPKPLLKMQKPVSFHKFWQLDPIAVYQDWFAEQDEKLYAHESPSRKIKKDIIKNASNKIQNKKTDDSHRSLINVELKTNHAEL